MSTHRLIIRRQISVFLSLWTFLSGVLIALQLWLALPLTALAAPSSGDMDIARAGVSIVRLLVTYQTTPSTDSNQVETSPAMPGSYIFCTGVGVIVASEPLAADKKPNNWILTDGELINPKAATCDTGETATLNSIQINLSNAYNSTHHINYLTSSDAVKCSVDGCENGPALLQFADAQEKQSEPYIDLNTALQPPTGMAVAMVPSSQNPVIPTSVFTMPDQREEYIKSVTAALTPQKLTDTGQTDKIERGTPFIDNQGKLVGMNIKTHRVNAIDLNRFLQTQGVNPRSQSFVHNNWNQGMDAYIRQDFRKAHQYFVAAASNNSNFTGASEYANKTSGAASSKGTESGQAMTGISDPINVLGVSLPIWQAVIAVVVLLALLLFALSILMGRSRSQHQRALQEEYAEAEREAAIAAQRIAQEEAAQRVRSQQLSMEPPVSPMSASHYAVSEKRPSSRSVDEFRCPNCGIILQRDANYCSNCNHSVNFSDSGRHISVKPPLADTANVSASPFVDQPTVPTAMHASAPPPPPVASLMPAGSLAEQPTLQIGPSVAEGSDSERTLPYARKKLQGKQYRFIIGTRSDPGIKRKYKPNEDSLFAAQGMLSISKSAYPYGLLVVADGMGGHAKGQDASRLAIQTIVNYVLPRLFENNGSGNAPDYGQLIATGVQVANQTVHQRNVDQRGDMGTTVTAALLVGTIAYVVNVGDSRTYLYRGQEGLRKITSDHSIVASLVEAGIIKPDDIYTHPKRSHIYRSLGEKEVVEVDLFTIELQEGDKILLCSDGLWDMVRDPGIEEVVKIPSDPMATGEALIQAALNGGGEDNVSVIVASILEADAAVDPNQRLLVLSKPETVQVPQV